MQQEFEQKVQDKLHDYFMEPSVQVWKDIAVSLEKPRKRRVFVWWFSAAAVLFVSAGIFIWNTDSSYVQKKNSPKHTTHFTAGTTALKNNAVNSIGYSPIAKQPADINFAKSKNELFPTDSKATVQENLDKLLNNYSSGERSSGTNSFNKNQPESNTAIENMKLDVPLKTFSRNNFLPESKSTETKPAQNTASKKDENKKLSGSAWSFLFGGGTTNTTSADILFQRKSESIFRDSRGHNDTAKAMRAAYTGFHITAGIQYSFTLNRSVKLYSALQYSFLLNHQRTGPRVIQPSEIATTYDTSLAANHYTKIDYHYPDGTSAVNTNRASWLEMPVGIGYTVNPSSKQAKVELRGGASFAHMFWNKWLVSDGRYNKFYYSDALTNDMIVNLHGDVVVTLPKNKIIGLQFQHSVTSFAKKSVQPSQYWSNISVYTTIPLHK